MNSANLHCSIEKPFLGFYACRASKTSEHRNEGTRDSQAKARQRTKQIASDNPLHKAQSPITPPHPKTAQNHVRPHGLQQMGRHRRQQRRGERRRSAKCAEGGPGADGREKRRLPAASQALAAAGGHAGRGLDITTAAGRRVEAAALHRDVPAAGISGHLLERRGGRVPARRQLRGNQREEPS